MFTKRLACVWFCCIFASPLAAIEAVDPGTGEEQLLNCENQSERGECILDPVTVFPPAGSWTRPPGYTWPQPGSWQWYECRRLESERAGFGTTCDVDPGMPQDGLFPGASTYSPRGGLGRLAGYLSASGLPSARDSVSIALDYHTTDIAYGGVPPGQANNSLLNALASACLAEMQTQLSISTFPSAGESARLAAFYRLPYEIDGQGDWPARATTFLRQLIPSVIGGIAEALFGERIGNATQEVLNDIFGEAPPNSLAQKAHAISEQVRCANWWVSYNFLICQ